MTLKRKRSFAGESPLSTSSTISAASTRMSVSPTPVPHPQLAGSMDIDTCSWSTTFTKSPDDHLATSTNVRTRKRYRNDRPTEHLVHESTLQRLFSGQKNQHHHQPTTPPSCPQILAPVLLRHQKTTLHAFWKLPLTPVRKATTASTLRPYSMEGDAGRCEYCDGPMASEDDGMELDGGGMLSSALDGELSCAGCGLVVCGGCAVLREDRRCLLCAAGR